MLNPSASASSSARTTTSGKPSPASPFPIRTKSPSSPGTAVIAVSKAIENDDDQTIRQYDKVLFDPREAIPVELEHDNRMFVVHIDRVLAIFRRSEPGKVPRKEAAPGEGNDVSDDV